MIVLLGIAGSGKSTQGQLLAKRLGCPWLSTGQLLRDHVHSPEITKRMLAGEVLSDDILLPFLDGELKKLDAAHKEFILDGSPRTMHQAEWLAAKIKAGDIKFTAVIHLSADEETVKKRLLARHRSDDHEEAIAERFREYEDAIKPIMDYLKSQGLTIHNFDGNRPPEAVAADINQALGV